MHIHDKAHELARALKSSPEYLSLISCQNKLKADDSALKMFLDYRKKEIAYQTAVMTSQKLDDADIKNLERLAEIVSLNTTVREYMQAEARFGVIFSDIQRIISDSVKELSSMYTQDEEGGND